MKILRRLFLAQCVLLAAAFGHPSFAADKPAGKPILILTGKISQKNDGDRYVFDMAMLEKLPQHSFTTKTPWFKEPVKFTGPLLRDVLTAAGASGETLTAFALNDYKTEIPAKDASLNVIVARLMDDKTMPVREKGPLFIIYPYDQNKDLQTKIYYSRAAWQLKAIEIK
ncbi:molybdopterin-dependent oxidoreductase [Polaromonas sp. AET17H-212]|uniref:molybdopterin-dependent oxidoreductase n=1 Tax=Polaromonas sp. AET17H-212 TaxID=1977061 RepID=UPI000BBB7318|nr:molybdopterin-dependent oxidoreductase [Polaromonas sp. AET17H-212]